MGKSKPTGPHADEMTGPGAWPETDEDIYTNRAKELGQIRSAVTDALEIWGRHQASIFNGVHVWSGDASNAAGTKVDGYTKAMRTHQQQLDDAITWCNTAASNIVSAKDTITANVTAAQQEIKTIADTAALTALDPNGDIRAVVEREYGENVATIDALAVGLGGKPGMPASPVDGPGKPDPNQPTAGESGTPRRVRYQCREDCTPLRFRLRPVAGLLSRPSGSRQPPHRGLPSGPGKP